MQEIIENTEEEDEDGDEDETEDNDVIEEVVISFACEDCDYRWEITVEDEEVALEEKQYCPMCGSANCTQI